MTRAIRSTPPRRVIWSAAAIVLVLAVLTELWAVDRRTLWLDEIATISASTRSWDSLAILTSRIDFVHWSYYSLLHVWFDVVGYSPFSLRAVSAIAVGCTAAVIVVLGQRLLDLATGLLAAVVFIAMPSVSLAAANGRSQALEMLFAALASLILVIALERAAALEVRRTQLILLWSAYVAVSCIGITLQLWFTFVVAGHAVTVVIAALRRRRGRWRVVVPAAAAMLLTFLLAVPFALRAVEQAGQISWLKAPTLSQAAVMLFRDQAFTGGLVDRNLTVLTLMAIVSWAVVVVGVVWSVLRRPRLLAVAVPWQFVPAVGLLVVTLLVSPTFTSRYLAMCCPALALLVATGLRALLQRWLSVLAGVLLAALIAGGAYGWYLARWGAPDTTDLRRSALAIAAARAADPDQRQALVFGVLLRTGAQLPIGYPSELHGVDDLTYEGIRTPHDYFWPEGRWQGDVAGAAAQYGLVWYVGVSGAPRDQFAQAIGPDFEMRSAVPLGGGVDLYRFERTG